MRQMWPVRCAVVRAAWGCLALGLLAGCTVVGAPGPSAGPPRGAREGGGATPPGREVRALWVVRSTMTSAGEIDAMVDRAAGAGFNTLLVQVRGRGDAFYRSELEPRGETITDGEPFDPLAYTLERAHARGLQVHAWINTHLVWGTGALPRDPSHLVRAHPEWLAVPRRLARALWDADPRAPGYVEALRRDAEAHADRVEGIYTSPSHPAVKAWIQAVWLDLAARYDVDGLHFDYVRFPSGDYDFSRGALERFRAWVSPRLSPARRAALEDAYATDPLAYTDALPGPWAEFSRAQITDLVRWIYHSVKLRRPDVVVSAAVFADQDDAFRHRYQAWPAWVAEGILDVAVPMAYTNDADRFRRLIRDGVAAAPGRLWAGIGAYLNTTEGTLRQIELARREGAAGFVLFSYDWAVGDGYAGQGPTLLEEVARLLSSGR